MSTICLFISKWIFSKIFDYSWTTLSAKVKQPALVEAFDKACRNVLTDGADKVPFYTLQSLGYSGGMPESEALLSRFQPYLQEGKVPHPREMAEILMDLWRIRKQQLESSEAEGFFKLPEDQAREVIERLANNFFVEILKSPEIKDELVTKILLRMYSKPVTDALLFVAPVDVRAIKATFASASRSLLTWPTTLGNKHWLDRSELSSIMDRISASECSATLILGAPGTGKSALMTKLSQELCEAGIPVIAVKADKIPSSVDDAEKLRRYLNLPFTVEKCLVSLSTQEKVVLVVDQLDALSEFVDQKSERLNVLLNIVYKVSSLRNIHIVCSSRPFEFRHDTRLNTIQAESLELNLLEWGQVEAVLQESLGVQQYWSDEAQQLLRVPLHLKLFLNLRSRDPSIGIATSLYGLLEDIWRQRVLNRDDSSAREAIINRIAQKMSESEELWVPRAIADGAQAALLALQEEDILVTDEVGLRIGFRHQTFFDFACARYFLKGYAKLSAYVIQRQDGLFIRPVLLSSLDYLRVSDGAVYTEELLVLWKNVDLRVHLRSLLIEYLAARGDPLPVEINCITLLIAGKTSDMHRALIAMAGSPGWFKVIKDSYLPDLMPDLPEIASKCMPLLIEALSFDKTSVLDLIRAYWLPVSRYDGITLNVLQYLKGWDENSVGIISEIAERTGSWNIQYIAEAISQFMPELAPRVVRADMNRQLREAKQKDAEQPLAEPPPDDATLEEKAVYQLTNDRLKHQKGLIETDMGWHDLSVIAESTPRPFLDEIWPWFLELLEMISHDPDPYLVEYQDDYSLGTTLDREYSRDQQPVHALRDAIEKLAESDEEAFLDFFKENCNSPFLAVHRLLYKDLQKITPRKPVIALDYLTSDPRNLVVGDHSDSHGESSGLIAATAPYLSGKELHVLEQYILEWKFFYKIDESWSAEDRLNRLRWERQHRLRLLRTLPDRHISAETKRIRDEEERVFPGHPNWDSRSFGGLVGSPMSAQQMAKGSNEDILNLFKELDDSTEWDHPRHKRVDEKLVGGVIQAARELGSFAEKYPERAIDLLNNLEEGRQEIPAGEIIQGLSKSSLPSGQLFSIIKSMNDKGFASNPFRTDVARAMEARAKSEKGLPDEVLRIMEDWLPTHSEPPLDRLQDRHDGRDGDSVLWGHGGFYSLPGGRDLVFGAIAEGYLRREPPDVKAWGRVIQRALQYEDHPDVWRVILHYMTFLFNDDRDLATSLFDQLFSKFPTVRDSLQGAIAIATVLHLVPDDAAVERWLNEVHDSDWYLGQQAFGELIMLYLMNKPASPWAAEQVRLNLENPDSVSIHRGLAYAAALNWRDSRCRRICTQVLVALARTGDEITQKAISRVFHFDEDILLNQDMTAIILAILDNPALLIKSASNLIEGVRYATPAKPELVGRICHRVLDVGAAEIGKPGSQFALLAEPLVSIALTLHRMPSPSREEGLVLFERLIETNIQEAQQALDMLDRKPFTLRPIRSIRRRHKRRNKSR